MPLGTTVDELCGQPEQKYGMRVAMSVVSARTRCASLRRATCAASCSFGLRAISRSPMQIAISFGSSAPFCGNSQLPRSSRLPMQVGWLSVP